MDPHKLITHTHVNLQSNWFLQATLLRRHCQYRLHPDQSKWPVLRMLGNKWVCQHGSPKISNLDFLVLWGAIFYHTLV